MSLLPEALAAIHRGWHIFPVEPGAKTPHRIYRDRPKEEAPWQIRWSEVATNDINKVIQWWAWSPEANVGVACKPSNLLVVDCDTAKTGSVLKDTPFEYLHDHYGDNVDGMDVFHELCERYGANWAEVTWTYTVCTPSMGCHLYYAWPEDVEASQASIVKGLLDIRCNGGERGGYVLAAGSATANGAYTVEADLPVASAPPWLVELVREKPRPAPVRATFAAPGSANYSGLVDAVRLAYEGNRNNVLLWAARCMCEDGATEEEAYELLVPAALECDLDGGERQARATIRSGYRLQGRKQ